MSALDVRKTVSYCEDLHMEGGRTVPEPLRIAVAAAVLVNPWAGHGYVEDLKPDIARIAPDLGKLLLEVLGAQFADLKEIDAFGKAAIVGSNGELEHASALIHTLRFGNVYRDAVGGASFLPFTNVRGGTGAMLSIPMIHKDDAGRRSHYLTTQLSVADAPAADELLVAIAGANGGRPFARIGDRYEDAAELAAEEA